MRIIARKNLMDFWTKHPDIEQTLKSRYAEIQSGSFTSPEQIKKQFPKSSTLANNRIVFRLKGNHYRLIAAVNYHYQILWIKFVGTHAEYDKIDANKIAKY